MKKSISYVIALIILVVILLTSLTFFGGSKFYPAVHATTNCPNGESTCLDGWAWSSNIGWVSFNSNDQGATGGGTYDVAMDSFGNLSGYAWSSNIGWISFNSLVNSSDGKCPADTSLQSGDNGSCQARVSTTTGAVYGWARALVGCQSDNWNGTACGNTGPGKDNGVGTSFWSKQTGSPVGSWSDLISSADGSRFVGIEYPSEYAYLSTDSGVTWNPITSLNKHVFAWRGIDFSSNGEYMVAATADGDANTQGYIYYSTDYGSTWATSTGSGLRYWNSVSSSADGSVMAAASTGSYSASSDYIYLSTNYGASWTAQTAAPKSIWTHVRLSQDGSSIVATAGGTTCGTIATTCLYVYTAVKNGSTWVWTKQTTAGARPWSGIKFISTDDKKLLAIAGDQNQANKSYLYFSNDGGISWATSTTYTGVEPQDFTVSTDSQDIIVSDWYGYIQMSTDGGISWISTPLGHNQWSWIAGSGDGTKAVISSGGNYNDNLYTYSPSNTGWDGWIHLSGSNNPTAVDFNGGQGVTYSSSTNQFLGYAWGSNVMGWLQFTPTGSTNNVISSTTCTGTGCPPVSPGSLNVLCSITASSSNATSVTVQFTATASSGNGSYTYSSGGTPWSNGVSNSTTYTQSTSNTPIVTAIDGSGKSGSTQCPAVSSPGNSNNGPTCVLPGNATWCSGTDTTKGSANGVSNSSCSGGMCQFYCSRNGYHLNSSGTSCVKSSTIEI